MKKDFGVKTWLYPMPVLMIATYNADGNPDAEKIDPISYDPVDHVYRRLTAPLAKAFKIGLEGR